MRVSMCWHCDGPVGKYGTPDPFLIEDDAPFGARICNTCHAKPELAITTHVYSHVYTLDSEEVAALGRRRGEHTTYWRCADLERLMEAARARHEAVQAAARAERQRQAAIEAAERKRVADIAAAEADRLAKIDAARRQEAMDVAIAELDDSERALWTIASTRYRSASSTADIPVAIVKLELSLSPTAAELRSILDFVPRYSDIESEIQGRLVGTEQAALSADVAAIMLRPRNHESPAAWISDMLAGTRTIDEFVSSLSVTGRACRPGCLNPKAADCLYVRLLLARPELTLAATLRTLLFGVSSTRLPSAQLDRYVSLLGPGRRVEAIEETLAPAAVPSVLPLSLYTSTSTPLRWQCDPA